MRLTALHTGIIVALMADGGLDLRSADGRLLQLGAGVQSLAPGLQPWAGRLPARLAVLDGRQRHRRGGGAGGVFSSLVPALAIGGHIRGSGFRAGPAEHPHQGVDRAAQAHRRPGGGGHWLRWHTGLRLSQRPRRPCRSCSTGSCSFLARLYIPNPALVRTIFALGCAYILVTGPWLIYDGRHWLIDVLGGYSYGAFYLLALTLRPTTGSLSESGTASTRDFLGCCTPH